MADEQVLIAEGTGSEQSNCPNKWPESGNGQTVKSTPSSGMTLGHVTSISKNQCLLAPAMKRKQNSPMMHPFLTKRNLETQFEIVETEGVNEVEMKDAESVDISGEQGIKEVEMQDAEITHDDKTRLEDSTREEGLMRPDISNDDRKVELNAAEERKDDQDIKETEKPTKVEASEHDEKGVGNEETRDGSGQRVLGEVATLLKQVEEGDAKAKFEVEVKVKKLDHEGVKKNGEINESQNTSQVSCT